MATRFGSGVVVPHPLKELYVLGVSGEHASEAGPCCRVGVAFAALDERTRVDRFGESQLERDGGVTHPLNQKTKQPVTERERLMSTMGGLAEANDMRTAECQLDWQQIGFIAR